MATIVRHKKDGNPYIVIGFGYGLFKTSRPGGFMGNIFPIEESDEVPTLAVCDADGQIGMTNPFDVVVIEVDGKPPSEVLKSFK